MHPTHHTSAKLQPLHLCVYLISCRVRLHVCYCRLVWWWWPREMRRREIPFRPLGPWTIRIGGVLLHTHTRPLGGSGGFRPA